MFQVFRVVNRFRISLLGVALSCGLTSSVFAGPVVVDFEGVNASGTSVTGAPLDAYLAGFGISVASVSPSGYPEIHNATDHGALSGFPAGFLTASSGTNFLSHGDGAAGGGANAPTNAPISFQLDFATLQTSVSFTRIQNNAFTSPSGSIVAAWSARALDALGNTLDTVGEPQLASFGIIGAATFTLNGAGIKSLVIERTSTNTVAGVNAVFIDDLVIDAPSSVPEPSGIVLLGLGIASVTGSAWRLKKHRVTPSPRDESTC